MSWFQSNNQINSEIQITRKSIIKLSQPINSEIQETETPIVKLSQIANLYNSINNFVDNDIVEFKQGLSDDNYLDVAGKNRNLNGQLSKYSIVVNYNKERPRKQTLIILKITKCVVGNEIIEYLTGPNYVNGNRYQKYTGPYNEEITNLVNWKTELGTKHKFELNQIVKWKAGARHIAQIKYDEPVFIMEFLPNSMIVVGKNCDGNLLEYVALAERFKPF